MNVWALTVKRRAAATARVEERIFVAWYGVC